MHLSPLVLPKPKSEQRWLQMGSVGRAVGNSGWSRLSRVIDADGAAVSVGSRSERNERGRTVRGETRNREIQIGPRQESNFDNVRLSYSNEVIYRTSPGPGSKVTRLLL